MSTGSPSGHRHERVGDVVDDAAVGRVGGERLRVALAGRVRQLERELGRRAGRRRRGIGGGRRRGRRGGAGCRLVERRRPAGVGRLGADEDRRLVAVVALDHEQRRVLLGRAPARDQRHREMAARGQPRRSGDAGRTRRGGGRADGLDGAHQRAAVGRPHGVVLPGRPPRPGEQAASPAAPAITSARRGVSARAPGPRLLACRGDHPLHDQHHARAPAARARPGGRCEVDHSQ